MHFLPLDLTYFIFIIRAKMSDITPSSPLKPQADEDLHSNLKDKYDTISTTDLNDAVISNTAINPVNTSKKNRIASNVLDAPPQSEIHLTKSVRIHH